MIFILQDWPQNGSDYIAQNASFRGFFAEHGGRRAAEPPNGRKGIRASDTRLSSRGPHSGRWCATGAPHPGTGVPWRGSYADSRPRPLRTAALRGCPWRVCPKSAPDGLLHQGAPARDVPGHLSGQGWSIRPALASRLRCRRALAKAMLLCGAEGGDRSVGACCRQFRIVVSNLDHDKIKISWVLL